MAIQTLTISGTNIMLLIIAVELALWLVEEQLQRYLSFFIQGWSLYTLEVYRSVLI